MYCPYSTLINTRHGEQTEGKRNVRRFAPLFVGLSLFFCHLGLIEITGCGVNPVRAFGPAVASNLYTDMAMYWFAPILGGIIAAIISVVMFGRVNPDDDKQDKHDLESGRTEDVIERQRRRSSIAHNNLKSPKKSVVANESQRSSMVRGSQPPQPQAQPMPSSQRPSTTGQPLVSVEVNKPGAQ